MGLRASADLGPETVTLGVRNGRTPSVLPPVRIFLGTEPAQHRAERVFVWSIERVRDPSRIYEIHLMKQLPGFEDRTWTTGFTNYRFAIPSFAGCGGRAIYNDVDQIYLADPGTLFDLELGDHGFLAVAPEDSSVMLIDCARMAELWSRESAASGKKTDLLAAAADRYGALEGRWNARDGEYRPDEPGVLHYTTLHTQPWRPFPERFVYQEGPHGDLWHGLEREADRARFGVFTRAQPSRAALELLEAGPDPALEDLPDEDVPWALDERFAVAERRLDIEVRGNPDRDAAWWSGRLRAASARHPEVGWELSVRDGRGAPALRTGGRHLGPEPPRVWVLTDDRPGNSTQSLGLAEALGWNTEEKRLCLGALSALSNRALGASLLGVKRSASEPLEPPWPDLVIGAGRRTAPVALWIRKQSRGRTRLVQLGRKGGDAADLFDLSVVPVYAGLFPHPQRISTHLPLHRLSDTRLAQAAAEWRERLERGKAPRIGLLVGGTSGEFRFDVAAARRLGRGVMRMAREAGGSVFATSSRRSGDAQTRALGEELEGADLVHAWSPDGGEDNPYLGLLALADAFVITGDSESMLAEALSQGRPVYIFPMPERAIFRVMRFFRDRVSARARALPAGPRDTPRPQQGLEYWCARAIDRGWVRPTRDLTRLHAQLIRDGVAREFGEGYAPFRGAPVRDRDAVVARVREMMGVAPPDSPAGDARGR